MGRRGIAGALLPFLIGGMLCAAAARAQQTDPPNGVFLVAKPSLRDPNFRQTVVLVTQTRDANTVGVIVNRPTDLDARRLLPPESLRPGSPETVYFGGPVMRQTLVAIFESDAPPEHPSFHVLRGLYLSMHPAIVGSLIGSAGSRYRIYSGFSGWAPRQLEGELARDGWYVLPADADVVFRRDTAGMWQEMIDRATQPRARREAEEALTLLDK
jgi:putative transcriptional regulator